jgi:hypothetical protein
MDLLKLTDHTLHILSLLVYGHEIMMLPYEFQEVLLVINNHGMVIVCRMVSEEFWSFVDNDVIQPYLHRTQNTAGHSRKI